LFIKKSNALFYFVEHGADGWTDQHFSHFERLVTMKYCLLWALYNGWANQWPRWLHSKLKKLWGLVGWLLNLFFVIYCGYHR
jgi:hypothetical protein